MTPEDHARSKENMTQMNITDFNMMIGFGYPHQYMANSVQVNRGTGKFSEVANLTGMANTDWSWGPLIADFNNDGRNDVFVSNGVKIDMNNRDHSNFIRQKAQSGERISFMEAIESWPGQTVPNYMFKNNGGLDFEKVSETWGLNASINTNGATYADLDNDGDLDLIWNNSLAVASIYRNESEGHSIQIDLRGSIGNRLGIGAQVKVKTTENEYIRHHFLSRGYMSSVDPKITVGLNDSETVEAITVRWSDDTQSQVTQNLKGLVTIHQDSSSLSQKVSTEEITTYFKKLNPLDLGINWAHKENGFNDFEKEILLPQKQSSLGPHLSVADFNNDGREDFFIPGAAGQASVLFSQNSDGEFSSSSSTFEAWKDQEDVAGLTLDANSDGREDLYVICGGNEFPDRDDLLGDRFYPQGETSGLTYYADGLPYLNLSGESSITLDFDADGDTDILLAGRLTPGNYPYGAPAHLLENINGSFAIKEIPGLKNFTGMVTASASHDLDQDGDEDIVLVGEWMPITILRNQGDDFSIETIDKSDGWWYSVELADMDNDGFVEIIAGNLGLNNKFHASKEKPFHVYAHDFDQNGSMDIVLSKEKHGALVPLRGKDCSSEQMPFISEKFPSFKEFASANLEQLYGSEMLDSALHLQAYTFESSVFKSTYGISYRASPLPTIAQFGPTQSVITWDVNGDGFLDIIGAGGIYNTENETARYDANLGYVLLNDGNGAYSDAGLNHGFRTEGNVKDIKMIQIGEIWHILVARNNDSPQLFELLKL